MIFARYPLAVILVLSAMIRLVYVLWFADYPAYLFSDMRGYWSRALEYADGDVTAYNQWRLSPVFAHAVLGEILIVLRSLGLPEGAQLGVVLLLNVAMSVASTYFVFDMAWRFSHRRGQALAAAAIFGFFPALIHYDAFVLSENPTIFTVLLSLWLTLKYRRNSGPLLVAGLALGCATMFRTVMGLIGLPCFLFLVAANRDLRSLLRGAVFSVGYFAVVLASVANVYQVSGGQITGASAVGGLNFFFMACKARAVVSQHQMPAYYVIPPSRGVDSQRGNYITKEPYHNQAYFFALGSECIRENPWVLFDNLLEVRHLFFTNFFPGLVPPNHAAAWRVVIRDASQWLAFAMFASLGLVGLLYRRPEYDRHILNLLLSIVFVQLVTMYFFLFEHRYVYPFLVAVLLPFVGVVTVLARERRGLGVGYGLATLVVGALLFWAAP